MIRVFVVHKKKLWILVYKKCAQWAPWSLIRLHELTGWSQSSLGAHDRRQWHCGSCTNVGKCIFGHVIQVKTQQAHNVETTSIRRCFNVVCPLGTHITPRIHAVWLKSSMPAWRSIDFLILHRAHSEDSDQTARMRSVRAILFESSLQHWALMS